MKNPRITFILAVAAAAIALHIAESARVLFLPAAAPLFNDFALLQYSCGMARDFFREYGALWGYDPSFMAGYPLTFIWNSNVAAQLLAVAFPHAEIPALLRALTFFSLAAAPAFFFLALRNFGFTPARSLAGTAAFVIYYRLSACELLNLAGMVTAGLSTIFNVWVVSLAFSYTRERRPRTLAAFIAAVALAPLIHKTAVVVLAVPLIACAVVNARRLRIVDWAAAAAAIPLTIAVNFFWLHPLLTHLQYKIFIEDAPFWQNTNPLLPLLDHFTPVARMNVAEFSGLFGAAHNLAALGILILGIHGLALWKKERRDLFAPFAATAAALFALSYFGSFLRPLAELNPTRYIPAMRLFLLIPAIHAAARLGGAEKLRSAVPVLIALLVGASFLESTARLDGYFKLLAQPPRAEVQQLVSAIKTLPPGGRVLLEDSGALDRNGMGQIYGLSQFPALLPRLTGREFIGGPYPYVFLAHRHAAFFDGRLFGQDIEEFTAPELREKFLIYNIRWIVCWSRPAALVFDHFKSDFRPAPGPEPFRLYEFTGWTGRPPRGDAEIAAAPGRIDVRRARPERGELILPYHWSPGIHSPDGVDIRQQHLADDPVPFIKIAAPPENFTLLFHPKR